MTWSFQKSVETCCHCHLIVCNHNFYSYHHLCGHGCDVWSMQQNLRIDKSFTPSKNNLFRKVGLGNFDIKSFNQTPRWAYFIIFQVTVKLHRPGQNTKFTNFLADLLVWMGLCSSALAWTMTKYPNLWVDWITIFKDCRNHNER